MRILVIHLALISCVVFGFCGVLLSQDSEGDGDMLVIAKGQDIAEDVIVFAKSVLVQGVARRGVASFGGSVIVEGTVRGDVAVVGGTLEIRDGGIVHGDVIVVGGRLQRGPLGRVDGKVFATSVFEEKLLNLFSTPSKTLLSVNYSLAAISWRLLRALTWLLMSLLIFKLFPMQIISASRRMRYDAARVLGVGMLAFLATGTALFVFLVLCVVLIGIPLIIIWLVFCLAAWIFGSVAFYYFFGDLVGRWLLRKETLSPNVIFPIGVVVYALLRLVPILTFILPFLVLTLAFGAVYCTRFGTGTPWFRKAEAQSRT